MLLGGCRTVDPDKTERGEGLGEGSQYISL